jgi:hypothetical protein
MDKVDRRQIFRGRIALTMRAPRLSADYCKSGVFFHSTGDLNKRVKYTRGKHSPAAYHREYFPDFRRTQETRHAATG